MVLIVQYCRDAGKGNSPLGPVLILNVAPTFRACPEPSEGSANAGLKARATLKLDHSSLNS
jgi:hypothetical protein